MRKKSEEFTKLQEWGETILIYLLESNDKGNIFIAESWLKSLYKCIEIGKLSIMKMLIGDLNEMVMGLNQKDIIGINRILMKKFGEDLMSGMAKRMAGVLTRGKIRNDEEFVRVNEWIDHLLWDKDNPDAEQQIEQYNQLLRDYEERAARRLRKKQS